VWEEEKPKRSLLGSLGWGSAASSASKAKPPAPEPIYLTELYAVVRGARRVQPRVEVLVAAAGDQVRVYWGVVVGCASTPLRLDSTRDWLVGWLVD
jgi:hypothetical protein